MSREAFIFCIGFLMVLSQSEARPHRAVVKDSETPVTSALIPLNHPIPPITGNDPSGSAPVPLTLDESIKIAIDQATTTLKAQNDVRFSGERLLQGYAQFLPNLVTAASYNYSSGRDYLTQAAPVTVQTKNYGPSFSVSTTLNLFNGLADINALKSAMQKKESSELSLKRAKQLIALDIAQSYLQVILDQNVVEIARKNLFSSQARQRLLQAQTSVGIRNL